MLDGEIAQAALASVLDALAAWIEEATALGRPLVKLRARQRLNSHISTLSTMLMMIEVTTGK